MNYTRVTTYTPNHPDEWLTPKEAVEPLLPFVKKGQTVWCPFDLETSQFVQVFEQNGIHVLHSHISKGRGFYEYEPDEPYDAILSNPPFTGRNRLLERLYALAKPFAMLMNQMGLFDSKARYDFFEQYGVELLVFRGRTCFTNVMTGKSGTPAFQCLYVCHNLLPKQIVFT